MKRAGNHGTSRPHRLIDTCHRATTPSRLTIVLRMPKFGLMTSCGAAGGTTTQPIARQQSYLQNAQDSGFDGADYSAKTAVAPGGGA